MGKVIPEACSRQARSPSPPKAEGIVSHPFHPPFPFSSSTDSINKWTDPFTYTIWERRGNPAIHPGMNCRILQFTQGWIAEFTSFKTTTIETPRERLKGVCNRCLHLLQKSLLPKAASSQTRCDRSKALIEVEFNNEEERILELSKTEIHSHPKWWFKMC